MASPISHLDNFGTNLTAGTSAGATTSPVNSVPSVAAPFYVAFDATNINSHYEMRKITSKTATNILHAATSYDHTTAEEVRIVNPAIEFDAIYQPQQGYLTNGKISVTDTGSGITVALVTLAGTAASVADPIYCRIGDTVRTITAALSVTKADGTNWMNAGGTELATKEIDYFVYLGYNATDGVVIGFSRIIANQYSDFSVTTTNEKYAAISTITTAASTDYYEVIGRFAATLSAGAGYTWSVPTFTAINLIQRPIYETRWLTAACSYTGFSVNPAGTTRYKIVNSTCFIKRADSTGGTSNATGFTMTMPFSAAVTSSSFGTGLVQDNGVNQSTPGHIEATAGSNSLSIWKSFYRNTFTAAAGKDIFFGVIPYEI